ncbi:acyltransferase domain-containing protein [Kribbella sp. NPDC056861]|uniref:acyltransferase domain-containing protein n=1 Tax=Kribbella sp. NPDC056861 TaxID=3154857 RepID=UPI0034275510
MLATGEAAERLGFTADAQVWLRGMPAGDGIQLPEDAAELIALCGLEDCDRREMLAARPDPVRDPEWWAVMAAMACGLERDLEKPVPSTGFSGWPMVPEASSEVGLFAWGWALLSAVPRLLEVHARRGVPEEITLATVSALGGVMGTHRQVTGRAGVGLFPLWGPPLRFRGADYQIGRHSFTRTELGLGDGVAGHVLMVHVPPIGPLDPVRSEESIAEAARSFGIWYPEEPVSAFVCRSWLLDPQLAEYLPDDSNILRFQRRFTVLPLVPEDDPSEGDREMMRLGLSLAVPEEGPLLAEDLARVPQETRLQRAFVAHLRAGGHWQKRVGVRRCGG